MFKREEVMKILAQAERIDSKYEMFGASKHQYKLNPPVDTSDEVEYYAIAAREAYEQNPEEYFVYEKADDNDLCGTDSFLELGTHGCRWDFGLITSGKLRGQIFDTDNEGAYGFVAYSFNEFYQKWLDRISDIEGFRKEVEKWRSVLQRRK